jgi:hypothetical protein
MTIAAFIAVVLVLATGEIGHGSRDEAILPGCGGPLLEKRDRSGDVRARLSERRVRARRIDLVHVRVQRSTERICLSLNVRSRWRAFTRVIVSVNQTRPVPEGVTATYNSIEVRLERGGARVLAGDYEDPQPVEADLDLRDRRMKVALASAPLLTLDPDGPFMWRVGLRAPGRRSWIEDTLPSDHETAYLYPSGRRVR